MRNLISYVTSSTAGIFIAAALLGCGQDYKASPHVSKSSDSKFARILQVGTDLANAPHNWLEFTSLIEGRKQTKFLYFKSPSDGTLAVLRQGYACTKKLGTYELHYEFKLANSKSGRYTTKLQHDDSDLEHVFVTVALKAGDKVRIDASIVGASGCPTAMISVDAAFKPAQ